MPLIRWGPFSNMDELVDDFYIKSWGTLDFAVDIYDDNGNVIVEMNVPGMNMDKIDIEVEDNRLYVSGSHEKEKEVEAKNYYKKEIKQGSFERVITLPCSVIADRATAETSNGILKIVLPKRQRKESNKIKVKKK